MSCTASRRPRAPGSAWFTAYAQSGRALDFRGLRPRAAEGEKPRAAGAVEEQRPASLLESGAALPAVPRELDPEEILPSSPPAGVTPEPLRKSAKPASSAFPPELIESLAQRFEAPDSRNRWDRPLFTVVGFEEPLPLAEIRSALLENRAPPLHGLTDSISWPSLCVSRLRVQHKRRHRRSSSRNIRTFIW
ncbi:protein KTI12 homolog [Alexandromys fortis]|uniref:protein KTI12 homolog n=1 Tax=Alexandromys fortis TaxID=100897 RepID=UPI002152AF2D|nr:protein KTI12 homolog [Microtus fortis]